MRRFLAVILLLVSLPGFSQVIHFPVEFWQAKPRTDTVSLYIVGDVLSHGKVVKSAETFGYGDFFKHLEGEIQGADVAVCNLEFPLAGEPYTGYPVFSGPDSFAQYLSDVGFDIFLTANNHILDKGTPGLSRTIDQLEKRGLWYTGIAATEAADTLLNPLMVSVKGIRIALVNFTYGTNQGASARWPKVHRMQKEALAPVMARARKADVVLVFPHWGIEYATRHNAAQEEMARWLVEQGADAIIGTHPHVVQDMQWMGEVPVYYSLGNALSNQNDLPARLEGAVTLRFAVGLGTLPTHLTEARMDYLWCTKPGMVEDAYAAVPVELPASCWRVPSDHETMLRTLDLVQGKAQHGPRQQDN